MNQRLARFDTLKQFAMVFFVSLALVACGGGGGGGVTSQSGKSYTISGTVGGDTLKDVAISLTGNATKSTTTDANGKFLLSGLANGDYTIAAKKMGYTFNPSNTALTVKEVNISDVTFTGTLDSASTNVISGTVTGAVIDNVKLTLSGASSSTTMSNANGDYSFTGLGKGNYTVTPSLTGYSFSPANLQATINTTDVLLGVFTSTASSTTTYTITGSVGGATAQGVTINLTGDATLSTTTDTNGIYSFTQINNGNYNIAPTKSGFTFNPSSTTVKVNGANVSSPTFTASTGTGTNHILTGTVTGTVTDAVLITLSGAGSATTFTNPGGNYSFPDLTNGSYTVTPSLTGYNFTPASAQATINNADATISNFVSSASSATTTYTLSGTVTGDVTNGVRIDLTGAASQTTTTDSAGAYHFTGLANGTYTATPSLSGYNFSPSNAQVTISNMDATVSNFTATAAAGAYSISGTVSSFTTGSAIPSPGITIDLTGDATSVTATINDGTYIFKGLANGNYTLTPNDLYSTYTPTSRLVTVNNANATGQDFQKP